MSKKSKSSKKPFNGLWIVLGLTAISVAVGVAIWNRETQKSSETKPIRVEQVNENGQTNGVTFVGTSEEPPPVRNPIVTKPHRLENEATKRLHDGPQKIKTVITTTGRAENAKWGLGGIGSFILTYSLDCDAEILEKSETPGGEIKVVEQRTFHQSRKSLRVYNTDVRFRLYETLPLKETFTVVNVIGAVLTAIPTPQTVIAGGSVLTASATAAAYLKAIDGTSARDVLKKLGIQIPNEVEKKIDDFVTTKIDDIIKTMNIEGKSYHITYYQDKKSGSPLRVSFTYADGRDIETDEEYLVLRRANAFLDAQVVPDKNCKPGDTWTIDTSDFECLLDPYIDGAYCGDVTVERLADATDGDWTIKLHPCAVYVKSPTGRTTGEMRLKSGEAAVDPENVYVKAMTVMGTGKLKNLTKHHLLFNSRFEGDCDFRGFMTTERQPKKADK